MGIDITENNPTKLIYSELTYQILGAAFEVFNSLGPELKEKTYHQAFLEALSVRKIPFQTQIRIPVIFHGKQISTHILDCLVDQKVVVELKRGEYFNRYNLQQVRMYLIASGCDLGMLINFTKEGVKWKRMISPNGIKTHTNPASHPSISLSAHP